MNDIKSLISEKEENNIQYIELQGFNLDTIEEEKESKPLWEKIYDFYNNHKGKIIGLLVIGSIFYTGYNLKKMTQMYESNKIDLRELERRIEENKTILKKMDEENSKINMWFAQTPKLPKPKVVNGGRYHRC